MLLVTRHSRQNDRSDQGEVIMAKPSGKMRSIRWRGYRQVNLDAQRVPQTRLAPPNARLQTVERRLRAARDLVHPDLEFATCE